MVCSVGWCVSWCRILLPRLIEFCGIVPVHPSLAISEVESRLFSLWDFFAVVPQHRDMVTQIVLFRDHCLSPVAERKLFGEFVNYRLRGTHVFLS